MTSVSPSGREGLSERLIQHAWAHGSSSSSTHIVKPLEALVTDAGTGTQPSAAGAAAPAAGNSSSGGKTGSRDLIFTLWNTMMGSTLLVMPYTFHTCGWLLALVLSVLSGVLAEHTCGLILLHADSLMADESAEFADFAHAHLGPTAKWVCFLSGNVVVLGAAVAMHAYMRTVLAHLVAYPPDHGGFCFAANDTTWPPQNPTVCEAVLGDSGQVFFSMIVLTVVLPLSNLPNVKWLSKLTALGVLCFLTVIGFALVSAAVSASEFGLTRKPLLPSEFAKPQDTSVVFGIFSLSFFIHNAVMTIMRGAAQPQHNRRDLRIAFVLVWLCYAAMGLSANLFPPLGDLDALGTPLSQNGLIALTQPPEMSTFLMLARIAVLVQSITLYPVLLFIVRSQLFTAIYFKRPYPGPLPVALLSCILATITTTVAAIGISISVVLKFVGAAGGLVCVFAVPALVHGRVHRRRGTLTLARAAQVCFLIAFGLYVITAQLVPAPS